MKKNGTMRVAVLLLALTLISACFVGGTFAKYTTSTQGSDSARVAYWGFVEDASTELELFANIHTEAGATDATVKSENGDNVVAPGTSGSADFAFEYKSKESTVNALTAGAIAKPEVAYTFTVDATITDGDYDALDDNDNFYWTLKAPNATEATKYPTVAELIAAVKALSGDASGSMDYAPGELPAAFTDADEVYTIGWEWEFETLNNGEADAAQDAEDTAMGNAQDLDDLTLTITITATQID